MKHCCLILTVLFFNLAANSQTDTVFYIRGKIVDEQQKPAPLANISLHAREDSSIRATDTSDNTGLFTISAKPGEYYLIISSVSFQDKVVPGVNIREKDLDLGTVILGGVKVLSEVVVVGENSQMKLELDKRVYNVGKDLANVSGTASDVLNNVPSVTVDVDGTVSLRGSSGVRILIDGKPSVLTSTADALRQLPANLIESIEVITNPSARYEAAGEAGVINIILKKIIVPG